MKFLLARLVIGFVTLAIYPVPQSMLSWALRVEVHATIQSEAPERITLAALPQERPGVELTERVLLRLEKAEKKEIDPWYRDDIRIAWITTRWAQSGVPEWSWHRQLSPHVAATYQVLGCPPDRVWPRIVSARQAKLGAEYSEIFPAEASAQKKPCVSAGLRRNQRAA